MKFIDKYHAALSRCNNSKLCIGLDTDANLLPNKFAPDSDSVIEFNKQVIENTYSQCIAYKINFAFYEALGMRGFQAILSAKHYIPEHIISIADAKRGDIGNTSSQYAEAVLGQLDFDSITVAPYMGVDSIKPFFDYKNKSVFVLALTSNLGSNDFQRLLVEGKPMYKIVIEKFLNAFGDGGEIGFVVGATHPEELAEIRELVGMNVPLLIPGVGSQGGSAQETILANKSGVAFVNVSRGICGQTREDDYISVIKSKAEEYSKSLV